MHEDKIANATAEQYSGYEPCGKGSEWIIDTKGIKQISNLWRCYFGGGETIDIDGDGVQDTLVKGEVNIDEYCYSMFGFVKPVLTITNAFAGIYLNSERDSGKVFDQYFRKHLNKEHFQNTFGKLFIKRISECLDYRFSYTPKGRTLIDKWAMISGGTADTSKDDELIGLSGGFNNLRNQGNG